MPGHPGRQANELQELQSNSMKDADGQCSPLTNLPLEIFDHIYEQLDRLDTLILPLVCCSLHKVKPEVTARNRVERAYVLKKLNRDRFLKLCKDYQAQPDPTQLPCSSCEVLHLKSTFFDEQILQADEYRSCRANGVVVLCPDKYMSWEDLCEAASCTDPSDTPYGRSWFGWDIQCGPCSSPIFLRYGSITRYTPRVSWKMPTFQQKMERTRTCTGSGWYTGKALKRAAEMGSGIRIQCCFFFRDVEQVITPPNMQPLRDALIETALPICPHLSTSSDKVIQSLHTASWHGLVGNEKTDPFWATEKGECDEQHCHTTFSLTQCPKQDKSPELIVEKDFRRIDIEAGPLVNPALMSQFTIRPSGPKVPLGETLTDYEERLKKEAKRREEEAKRIEQENERRRAMRERHIFIEIEGPIVEQCDSENSTPRPAHWARVSKRDRLARWL